MKDLFSIEGKVALVTGGSRGIGEMIAAGFLASGAKVYISSRKKEVCDQTAERLSTEYGGTCISMPSDLSNLEGIDNLVSDISKEEMQQIYDYVFRQLELSIREIGYGAFPNNTTGACFDLETKVNSSNKPWSFDGWHENYREIRRDRRN